MKKTKLKIEKPKPRRTWQISPVTRVKPSGKIYKRKGKERFSLESQIECEELMGQKNYRYCPRCSSELIQKKIDHHIRKVCPVCDFVIYRNPAPASAVIITRDNKILLVKRKCPPFKGDWSLPAGFIEYNESPEQCAIRETKEETNLEVKLTKLFNVYSGADDPRTKAILIVYLARVISGNLKPGDDAAEAVYFSFDNIPSNIAFAAHRKVISDFYQRQR
jgi:ADP-ribose pyrophosphatase YjhB (NUDIX family)